MVKRTLFVLGILCVVVMMAAPSFAAFGKARLGGPNSPMGWGWMDRPVFCPAPCLPYPVPTTVIKKWEAKIVSPAPVPCGGGFGYGARWGDSGALLKAFPTAGLLGGFAIAAFSPLDMLFGGDGVYGCTNKRGGGSACGFGPCVRGPLPGVLFGVPHAVLSSPITVFGTIF